MSRDSKIYLVLLWHMHQPFYKDLVSGEYRLPWVRMHALKDYYGMVKLLDEFPNVHQNFNLVPSLLEQLQDYAAGTARDPFYEIVAKPAAQLGDAGKRFALQYLFQANPDHMIGRYPRYRELFQRYLQLSGREHPEQRFDNQDITDLQVLSQVAWFDEFFLERPEIKALVAKGSGFTADDQRTMLLMQREIISAVIPAYVEAAKKGSIEISATPYYHPILPLICDTYAGEESSPGLPMPQARFQRHDDAEEQIVRALDYHEKLFHHRPAGLWPSEGSVSEEAIAIAAGAGVQWMATDEGVLGRTLGKFFERDLKGQLNDESARDLFKIYRYEKSGKRMHMVFRDHRLSDLVGFVYQNMPAADAAQHLLTSIHLSARPVLESGRDAVIPIILDGENAWESYPKNGREFLRRFYDGIQNDPRIEALTISEAIARTNDEDFGRLDHLVPGSWINANFNVWIGAPEDNKAWDHLSAARRFFDENAHKVNEEQRELAYEELLIAEGSDWNWWYGPEHHSANDRDFDELYRKHLSNVYQALGASAPDELAQPIITGTVRPMLVPQTAYIHPTVDGREAGYFDWMGAAMYTADRRTSSMHGKQFFLDAIYAGVDENYLYGRLDFAGEVPPAGVYRVIANIEVIHDEKTTSFRLIADAQGSDLRTWSVTNGEERHVLASSDLTGGSANLTCAADPEAQEIKVAIGKLLECRLPHKILGARHGDRMRIRFSLWREKLPLDALPVEGWLDLRLCSDSELEENTYNYTAEA
ncbi:glycoside hydrolase, family 57 [Candidatus Koribacter versatilis Ellin345]|uniref:Glycoside hydrolase, family 57 n=1 Tax=Koribacter versatilis (strain Ellin345) TaxID=204669 RepID=Q1IRI2_KORVE|nr:glycoside hydrolase family 57 protein [Candidatus Koribacter versatilis]ABF40518.1 glycoside hydrolase, family 57 [Candidatus Koribacter versatilis Ellin345]